MKSFFYICLSIFLFRGFSYCVTPQEQIDSLDVINKTFILGWDLSTIDMACSNTGITCNSDLSVTTLTLTSSIQVSYPTDAINFPDLKSLSLQLGPIADSSFFESTIRNFQSLEYLSILEPVRSIKDIGANFPKSLKTLIITIGSNDIDLSLFTQNSLTTLAISAADGVDVTLPDLKTYILIESLTLANIYMFAPSNLGFLKSLKSLTFQRSTAASWNNFNNFDLLPSLNVLHFQKNISVEASLMEFPTSIFSCSQLTDLSVEPGYFRPLSTPLNLSKNQNLLRVDIYGSLIGGLSKNAISVKSNQPVLSISGSKDFTDLSIIDLTPFASLFASFGSINKPLVDQDSFYQSKQIYLANNSISGTIPDSFCNVAAFSLANNQIEEIPNCMRCSMKSIGEYISGNLFSPKVPEQCEGWSISELENNINIPSNGGFVTIRGTNLGWDGAQDGNNNNLSLILPNTAFSLWIGAGVNKNNSIDITFHKAEDDPKVYTLYYGYAEPKIQSISLDYTSSGIVISGSNFGTPAKTTVQGSSGSVYSAFNVISFSTQQINGSFNEEQLLFSEKLYITVHAGDQSNVYTVTPSPPFNSTTIPLLQKSGGTATITAPLLPTDSSILGKLSIDGVLCNITSFDSKSFTFTYPELPRSGNRLVQLTYSLGATSYAFINIEEPAFPTCVNKPHGTCNSNGSLICEKGWTGFDCSSQIIVIDQQPNIDGPSTSINSTTTLPGGQVVQFSTLIAVPEIREYNDITGELVHRYFFKNWTRDTSNSSDSSDYIFHSTFESLDGKISNITISIKYFKSTETIIFANQSITMNPSSIKYQIELSQYSFQKSFNRLMVLMNVELEREIEKEDSCSAVSFGEDPTSYYSDYMKLKVNEISLYGKFIKYGILDGRSSYISNFFFSDTNQDISTKRSLKVGLNIPHYSESALLDPDFSVLVESNPANADESDTICSKYSKKGLTRNQLIGVIVGSVCGFIVLSIIVGFIIYRRVKYSAVFLNLKSKVNMKKFGKENKE